MKKLITMLSIAVAVVGIASAQTAGPKSKPGAGLGQGKPGQEGNRQGKRGEMMKKLMAQLDLSADQKTKIEKIQNAQKEAMQKLMTSSLSQEEKRSKMREAMQKTQKDIQQILTPEQRKKMAELMKEFRQKSGKKGGK